MADSFGYSVEEVSLALGVMANSGIKASSAGTALRSLLTNMAKPTKASAAAMEKLGISLTDGRGKTKELGRVMKDLRSGFAGLTESQKAEYAASLAVETVVNGVTTAVNAMISGINTVTGAVGVPSIPSIPSVTLPRLAKGTQNWKGGLVQVSERGGEVIDLPKGSRVYPHDKSLAMAREEGRRQKPQAGRTAKTTVTIQIPKLADQIIIREDADIDKLADAFADRLEKVSRNVGGEEIEYSY